MPKRGWLLYSSLQKDGRLYFSCGSYDSSQISACANQLKVTRQMCSLTRGDLGVRPTLKKMLSSPVSVLILVSWQRLTMTVMLRVLEYFKGILIMTTNRIMTFDVATLSRCHYAIDFKSLTREQEKKIWQSYVDRLNEDNSEKKSDIKDWVAQVTKKRTKLSGREIRNVFTTAQTLAQAEPNKKIRRTHLERVYERLTEFLDAMEKTKATAQAQLTAS